ncbi:MAG: hypothetical protein L0154_09890 [Chloroflexi bacterium]|nr:hypothetical protein [Chloroflexota bacterium]
MGNTVSRRKFLQGLGGSIGVAMLANMGLPAVLAQENRLRGDIQQDFGAGFTPDVELLCGDVTGFQLESDQWEGAFGSVTFQMHRALYNGEAAYYIRTDASDQAFADANKLVFVPLLNAALAAAGATSHLYTFENGVEEQFPVISSIPSDEAYSPAWQVHRVTFSGTASLLDSESAIRDAEAAGDVSVEALPLVLNHPLVKWPGGELPVDTELVTYLGTGPLISAPNTERMRVTFKLHQCYPGSRYIITDTSAAPMAPMMGIAPSPVTDALRGVGATDEIWVFGNGIAGSGVMGFQPAVFDHEATNAVWSPFWDHFTAVWADPAAAVVVTSSDQLRQLIDSGALEIFHGTPDTHPTGFIVNCPVPLRAANTFHLTAR